MEEYIFKIVALLVLLFFISGIGFFEHQFLQEKLEPSLWEINGFLGLRDVEGFQNGTVIFYVLNDGPVPVNLTEVFINEVEKITRINEDGELEVVETSSRHDPIQIITSVRQEIPVNKTIIIPITVTFSTENIDFDKQYSVGYSWMTETGCGSIQETEFYFSILEK
jgi:hypothetical protein